MSDDVVLNSGSGGDTVATDEVGGKQYQWIKLAYGADDTATKVEAGVGLPVAPDTGGFPVESTLQAGTAEIGKLAAGVAEIGNVKNAGTFVVQIDGAALTALQLIDNIVSGSEAQVDVVAALPAGANTIGKVDLGATDNAVLDSLKTVLDLINAKLVTGTVIGDVNLGATDNAVLDSIVTNQSARSTGGAKLFTSVDLDESEEDPTSGATTIYSIYAWNTTAAPLWLQLFNTNTVTVGTTAPTNNYVVPANADSDGAGVVLTFGPHGLAYGTALTVAMTTGSGTDAGAPGAGAGGVAIVYKD